MTTTLTLAQARFNDLRGRDSVIFAPEQAVQRSNGLVTILATTNTGSEVYLPLVKRARR
jgi:hypothetical protein